MHPTTLCPRRSSYTPAPMGRYADARRLEWAFGPRRSNISAQQRLTQRSEELSLGHDPDLIARYLAGEQVTEQLRELEDGESDYRGRPEPKSDAPSRITVISIDGKKIEGFQQAPAALAAAKPQKRPTLALIALGIALGMFVLSVWIALR